MILSRHRIPLSIITLTLHTPPRSDLPILNYSIDNQIKMDTSACIKEVNRSASVAFAPEAPLIVAGTMAGAVDMSFSSSANLEIFQLDFQSDDRKLPLVGAIPITEPFNRLSWGKSPTAGSEEFSLGLVAGGLVDGNITRPRPQLPELIDAVDSVNGSMQKVER